MLQRKKLWYVPKGVDSLNVWVEKKKPVWCWIEVTKIDNQTSNRKPTTIEVKAEVWMALIHGASGFGYFCHSWQPVLDVAALLNDATMLAAVTNINKEITSLARVLNSTNTTYVSVASSNTGVPIDIMTKNYNGANYLFAVGMRPGSTTATFTVNAGNKAEVIGENRSLTITAGKFTDDFSSYGVHLYRITNDVAGMKESVSQQFKVYPNPVSKNLFIENVGPAMLGRSVISGNLGTTAISVVELTKGCYFILFMNTAGKYEGYRFLKE